jgi:hypothetical protein
MDVYLLWHVSKMPGGAEDAKLIGVYASAKDAERATIRLLPQPGFRDAPNGFSVERFRVGEDHWTQGYVYVAETHDTSPKDGESAKQVQPTPKIPDRVSIPSRLFQFFCRVHQDIEAGLEAATTIESDDLLQDESTYGGLIDASKSLYGFCHFAGKRDETWAMVLTRDQIGDIAAGKLTVLNLWKCDNAACRCRFESPDAFCMYCEGGHAREE